MGYAAIGLSIVGFAVGLKLRLKALLWFAVATLIASIVLSIRFRSSFPNALLIIFAAQTILQSSYFVGLVAREFVSTHRMRPIL